MVFCDRPSMLTGLYQTQSHEAVHKAPHLSTGGRRRPVISGSLHRHREDQSSHALVVCLRCYLANESARRRQRLPWWTVGRPQWMMNHLHSSHLLFDHQRRPRRAIRGPPTSMEFCEVLLFHRHVFPVSYNRRRHLSRIVYTPRFHPYR